MSKRNMIAPVFFSTFAMVCFIALPFFVILKTSIGM